MANKKKQRELYYTWKSLYKEKNGGEYDGNVYRDGAVLGNIADDIGEESLIEAMRYYFKIHSYGHKLLDFMYNYDELLTAERALDADEERRARIRRLTKERMEEIEQRG